MFTNEDIKMMAEFERKMDSGDLKHVIWRGNRMAISDNATKEFNLESGQTINDQISIAITQFEIADCKAKIEAEKIFKKAQS